MAISNNRKVYAHRDDKPLVKDVSSFGDVAGDLLVACHSPYPPHVMAKEETPHQWPVEMT